MADRTFAQLQNEVLEQGFDASEFRDRVKRWLNEAQHRLLRLTAIPSAETTAVISAVNGTQTYSVPSTTVRIAALIDTTTRAELEDVGIDVVKAVALTARGRPTAFAQFGGQLWLTPTPDATYSLELRYRSNATMDADTDPPAIVDDWADLLVMYATMRAWKWVGDLEMEATFKADWLEGKRLFAADVQMQNTGRVRRVPSMFIRTPYPEFQRP